MVDLVDGDVWTEADLKSLLFANTGFCNNPPASAEDANCLSKLLGPLVFHATDTTLSVDSQQTIEDCLSTALSSSTFAFKANQGTLHYFSLLVCPTGGLLKYDGRTLDQLAKIAPTQFCSSDTQSQSQMMLVTDGSYTFTDSMGATTTGNYRQTNQQAHGTSQAVPCSNARTTTEETANFPCSDFQQDTSTLSPSTGNGNYSRSSQRVKLNGVAEALDLTSVWPSSGKSDFIFDNWTGTVTYAGPSTPPSYTAVDLSGHTSQGQFPAPSASLGLTSGGFKPVHLSFPRPFK